MIRISNRRENHGLATWDIVDDNGNRLAMVRTRRVEAFGENLMVLLPGGKRHYVQDHQAAMALVH